ncbi:GH16 beta-1,3-glucan recognition protein [Mycena filopes]|nr:GH16 beta-1,3-glucan recognition protein [Mycena filopes]
MARPAPLQFAANASADTTTTFPGADTSEPPSPTAQQHGSAPHTPRSLSFLTPPHPPRDSFSTSTPNANANPFATPGSFATNFNNASGNANGGGNASNPFSPPASVLSFSAASPSSTPLQTPMALPTLDSPGLHHGNGGGGGGGYPFPSPGSTRASSLVDVHVPRAFSTYSIGGGGSSRPSTGGSSGRPTSAASPLGLSVAATESGNNVGGKAGGGVRPAFASPPPRPTTLYAAPPPSSASLRARGARAKSTALLVPSSHAVGDAGESYRASLLSTNPKTPPIKIGTSATLTTALSKPWVGVRDRRARVAYWLTYGVVLLGLAAGAARIYTSWTGVMLLKAPLCPVLLEDFSSTTTAQLFGSGVAGEGGSFFREVDASGFGNGEFEMTTARDANSFVYNNQLYLVPTLTSEVIPEGSILDGAIYNLTDCTYNITHSSGYTTEGHGSAGINTTESGGGADGAGGIAPDTPLDLQAYLAACSAVSNATQGRILPPVMSARISTRRSASLKYGRVEVRAKLPTGDWLWPAIWMLPVDSAYGPWPLSGEIDIMEARGNGPKYPKQGINYVRSSLNWGPATFLNAVAKTYGWLMERRGRFDEEFHTFALEWSEDFIRTYVDSRLKNVYETKISESFWQRGDFPTVVQNGTQSVVLENPWVNGTKAAPFDQPFYLIMNVAVGGTNGWFPDGPEKPWLDGSGTAALDFLRAQDQWYPTWPQDISKRAMVIDSVKMWEQC